MFFKEVHLQYKFLQSKQSGSIEFKSYVNFDDIEQVNLR